MVIEVLSGQVSQYGDGDFLEGVVKGLWGHLGESNFLGFHGSSIGGSKGKLLLSFLQVHEL